MPARTEIDPAASARTTADQTADANPDPSSNRIVLRNVGKVFGRTPVLRNIHFEFQPGKLYTLVGDNGAGKSTLLRLIAGLARPTTGDVRYPGDATPRTAAAQIGYMGHASQLYDEMSGRENLEFFAGLYGLRGAAAVQQADLCMQRVGLDPALERAAGQYSQGMRQRLSLARALLQSPRFLLLDEPFSNVDAGSAQSMARLIGELRDQGCFIIVVTHQPALLEPYGDELLALRDGGLSVSRTAPTAFRQRAAAGGGATSVASPKLLRSIYAGLAKDLRLEWRSKDALNSVLFFALLVVVIFSFTFDPSAEESRHIAGGLIWLAFLFASVVALNQAWGRELRNRVLDALRVSPAPSSGLFVSKALSNLMFVAAVETLLTPLFIVFYNLSAAGSWTTLLLVFVLGTWALVVNGTFFAALLTHARDREMMLPLLLFPISIPAIISMVEATTAILTGDGNPGMWLKMLAGYDVVFTTACVLLFDTILHAE